MHSRSVFILSTIAIFLFLVSSSVTIADDQHSSEARKLANAPWMAAPHHQAFSKRGRLVFRNAQNGHFHDLSSDAEDTDDHPAKRNWRL